MDCIDVIKDVVDWMNIDIFWVFGYEFYDRIFFKFCGFFDIFIVYYV